MAEIVKRSQGRPRKVNKDKELSLIIEQLFIRATDDMVVWGEAFTGDTGIMDIETLTWRKKALALIKDEIAVITKLKELRVIAMEDDRSSSLSRIDSAENNDLMEKASKLLKKKGVSVKSKATAH